MKINIYTNTATSLFLCSIFYKQLKFGHSQQKFGLDRAVFLCYNTTVKKPNRADKFKKSARQSFIGKQKGKSRMQTNKSIAVVGSGWRAFTWFNIINVMPGVTLKTVVCRNAEKAEQIRKMYPHARVVADIEQIESADHVLLCVNKASNVSVAESLLACGYSVFCETPAGFTVSEREKLKQYVGKEFQITEQYPLRPRYIAIKKLAEKGYFGKVHTVEVSCCHSYHAAALIRAFLQTQKKLPEITKTLINDEYYESDGRNGKKPPELKDHQRVMALLDFGDRRAIYDFSHAQYFSLIRSERFAVKGTAGEIFGDKGYRLKGESEIPFDLMPIYSGTDCSLHAPELDKIVCDGEVLFENPFTDCRFSEEEIAMALWLKLATELYDKGEALYPACEGAIDATLAAEIENI